MTLSEFLNSKNLTLDSIEKVYHGKDNYCRCGCGGNYFYTGETGFTRAVNALKKSDRDYQFYSDGYSTWANIPLNEWENKAYTIYFKKGN